MPKGKESITKDLLPPLPDGVSIEAPRLRTIRDLNLRPFFVTDGTTGVNLSPDVVRLFPQLLPLMEWVAQGIKRVLKKQHEIACGEDEAANEELVLFIDQLVRTLNERIPTVVASVVLKSKYLDKPNLNALIGDKDIPSDDELRLLARQAIDTVVKMGVLKSRAILANDCDVNRGQLSNFVRAGGPMSMEKVVECLEYAAAKAQEAGRFDELKTLMEQD